MALGSDSVLYFIEKQKGLARNWMPIYMFLLPIILLISGLAAARANVACRLLGSKRAASLREPTHHNTATKTLKVEAFLTKNVLSKKSRLIVPG